MPVGGWCFCPFRDVEDTYWAQRPRAHSTISTLWKCDRFVHPLHTKTECQVFWSACPNTLLAYLVLWSLSLISIHMRGRLLIWELIIVLTCIRCVRMWVCGYIQTCCLNIELQNAIKHWNNVLSINTTVWKSSLLLEKLQEFGRALHNNFQHW